MRARVVLDASAFDVLDTSREEYLRALLHEASRYNEDAYCAAVTLAEVCRGTRRTRQIEAALARRRGGRRIRIVPTDAELAKKVGAILHDSNSGSERLGDAHVVAACVVDERVDTAIVVTSDSDDIRALAQVVRGVRVLVRDPMKA